MDVNCNQTGGAEEWASELDPKNLPPDLSVKEICERGDISDEQLGKILKYCGVKEEVRMAMKLLPDITVEHMDDSMSREMAKVVSRLNTDLFAGLKMMADSISESTVVDKVVSTREEVDAAGVIKASDLDLPDVDFDD